MPAGTGEQRHLRRFTILYIKKQSVHYRILRSYKDTLHDCNGWFDQLGGDDSPLAEAILDRIKHDAYKINIIPMDPTNYRSMREVYGLDPALSE